MDPRVIDTPWLLRRLLVSCFILPFRPRKTAAAYRSIWNPTGIGSPLLAHSQALHAGLSAAVAQPVALAMRYGTPGIDAAIDKLLSQGVDEILLVTLYPQHAASTRTTTIDEVRRRLEQRAAGIELHVFPPFHDAPEYLDALSANIRRHLPDDAQLLVFSYHGLPERHVTDADPTANHCLKRADCCEVESIAHASCYRHQCLATSRAVAARLDLAENRVATSFQSRLGRLPWLLPHTDQLLSELPQRGITRLAITAPAFVADNLETLEELGIRGREQFMSAGGERFTLLPCLNDDPEWLRVLQGWCEQPLPESPIDQ